jgi:redox-sensitive bicupin YhaK (pirin superfamily)
MQTLDAAPGNTIEVRPGNDRGTFTNHWLHARFSFSFGAWQQPGREGFGPLRALNEDIVQPAAGFDMHTHRDLDIFMLPLSGVVEHRDSLGHLAQVRPGQVQRMFAGRGIRHSQTNASMSGLDHHLQIWLTPRLAGGTPTVEARDFDLFTRPGEWCPVISPDGRAGSFVFDADAFMATSSVREGEAATWWPREASMVYLHAIDGSGIARAGRAGREIRLDAGDALAILRTDAQPVRVESQGPPARFLIFEFSISSAV